MEYEYQEAFDDWESSFVANLGLCDFDLLGLNTDSDNPCASGAIQGVEE